MTKYQLAVHNLRMANTIYTPGEQLFEENKRDLDVLDEAVEELIECKGIISELKEENELLKKVNADLCDRIDKLTEELEFEKEHKAEYEFWLNKLYKENEILKDGIEALHLSGIGMFVSRTDEELEQIGAILEVVRGNHD